MKKINTILAAVSALLMLTVTSANSIEFKAGVSANGMAAYANAKETLKGTPGSTTQGTGRTTSEEAILATSFASGFLEVSSDVAMGLGIGISYAPEVVDLEKETRGIRNQLGEGLLAGDSRAGVNDTGDQIIDGKIQDLLSVYLTLPVGDTGAYFKAGWIQATLITSENLATGSKYEDIDMTGTTMGGGYEGSLGDMAFWRAEGTYQRWDDLSAGGSEAGGSGKNKIEAEVGSITGSLSLGMKF